MCFKNLYIIKYINFFLYDYKIKFKIISDKNKTKNNNFKLIFIKKIKTISSLKFAICNQISID